MKVCHKKVDTWRPKVNYKFESVCSNPLGKAQRTVAMEQTLDNRDFDLKEANVKMVELSILSPKEDM